MSDANYADYFDTQVRLVLLRLLSEATEYRANSTVLCDLAGIVGFAVTRAKVRTQIAWLEEQGLLTTTEPMAGLIVATATERGLDVAAGRAKQPGVARPAPKG